MKKNFKITKLAKVIMLSMAIAMTAPTVAPLSAPVTVSAAAKVKLNATKKTLKAGESFTLKAKGCKKATFTSNKKAVATVSKSGKVTAKKGGKATITVKADGKKLTCKVTVTEENKFLTNAPFEAKEAKVGDNTIVVPKDWVSNTMDTNGLKLSVFMPSETSKSSINIHSTYSQAENADYEQYEAYLKEALTEDYLKKALAASMGEGIELVDFKLSTVTIGKNKVHCTEYAIKQAGEIVAEQKIYDLFAGGYTTEATVTKAPGEEATPELDEVANYMLESISFKK